MIVSVQNIELIVPQFSILAPLTTVRRLHSDVENSGVDEMCWMLWYLEETVTCLFSVKPCSLLACLVFRQLTMAIFAQVTSSQSRYLWKLRCLGTELMLVSLTGYWCQKHFCSPFSSSQLLDRESMRSRGLLLEMHR